MFLEAAGWRCAAPLQWGSGRPNPNPLQPGGRRAKHRPARLLSPFFTLDLCLFNFKNPAFASLEKRSPLVSTAPLSCPPPAFPAPRLLTLCAAPELPSPFRTERRPQPKAFGAKQDIFLVYSLLVPCMEPVAPAAGLGHASHGKSRSPRGEGWLWWLPA